MISLPPIPGATVPATAAAPTLATVLGGDGVLAKLAAAGTFDASIIQAAARGAVLARTPAGDLSLRLPFPLPEGSRLTLQVPAGEAASPTLRIVAVNGRPTAAVGVPAPATPSAATAAPTASPPPVPDSLPQAPGSPATFQATVLSPPESAPSQAGPAAPAAPAPGSVLSVRIVAVEPPAMPDAPSALSPPGAAPKPFPPAPLPSPAPTIPATAPGSIGQPPPQTVLPQSPALALPQGPSATLPQAAPSPLPPLVGLVTPNTHEGHPLVQTPIGLLALSGSAPLPAGAAVTLQVVSVLAPPPPPPPAALPATAPGGQWPALAEAMQVLQRADPAAAEALARILPQADGRAAANVAVFAAAARSGDARAWLGDALGALERSGRKDVAKRLADDVGELGERLRQPASGEWRALPLPFFGGEGVEAVRMVVRRPPGSGDEASGRTGGDDGIRFLVDLRLSQLGRMQIDGLVRRSQKRFDLVLRTAAPLPEAARAEIGGIFAKTLEGLGMAGGASFQVTERFVETAPGEAPHGWRGMVV